MKKLPGLAPLIVFVCVLAALWVTNVAPISYLDAAHGGHSSGSSRPSSGQLGNQNGAPQARQETSGVPLFFEVLVYVLLGAILLVLLVLVLSARRGSRPAPRERLDEAPESGDAIEALTVPAQLVDNAERQLLALREGTPRNAIVACWRELERSCGATGFPRRAAETSAEFTGRVLARYRVVGPTIETFAELFREARFSVHGMTEDDRELAVTSLQRILADLSSDPARSAKVGGVA